MSIEYIFYWLLGIAELVVVVVLAILATREAFKAIRRRQFETYSQDENDGN